MNEFAATVTLSEDVMEQPLISFVILTRNRREQVARAIESVLRQEYPQKEVVVVDNGSTDGTVECLRERFPSVKVVALKKNLGVAAGKNSGIRAASGEYLVLLDDDCVLEGENAAAIVVNNLTADPECGAMALRIADPLTGDTWPYNPHRGGDRLVAYECAQFCAGGVAFRRKMLDEVGLFWEPFFLCHEDIDLSLRIVRSGWKLMRRGDVVVLHPKPDPKAPINPRREIYYYLRATVWLLLRKMPFHRIPRILVPMMARLLMLSVRHRMLQMFVRAVVDSLKGAPMALRERNPLTREQIRHWQRLSTKMV
jgi:GT2 family glycosyltransferase